MKEKRTRLFSLLFKLVFSMGLVGLFALAYLDAWLLEKFDEKAYSQPASVYARPLALYQGMAVKPLDVISELQLNHYREAQSIASGTYELQGNANKRVLSIFTKPFAYLKGMAERQHIQLHFSGERLQALYRDGEKVSSVKLAPIEIGRIHPNLQNRDRLLVKLDQVPEHLVYGLLATEDRQFYQHHGVSPKAIARAFYYNVKQGGLKQGGSTLTQQLVKNFFLSSERNIGRKAIEAVMAILLELHADKNDILEAYINEVFIAQDGARAIHGFGLASEYLFAKPLADLKLHQTAMLVAMLKGPSYYNPLRHPERAMKRRNLVIDLMAQQQFISPAEADAAKAQGLALDRGQTQRASYPAYIDLVRRQLRRDYSDADLANEGLRIFTHLDPIWQMRAQRSLRDGIANIEQRYGSKAAGINGAIIMTNSNSSEVIAVVGGKTARASGFNRALDARRQIGSLIKPAVYLSALEQGYSLHSVLKDRGFSVEYDNQRWQPENFNHKENGDVLLLEALSRSYNLATARLALDIGLENVIDVLQRLGLQSQVPALPALSLGAADLSPLAVVQLYNTISSRGFYSPLKAIRQVTDKNGQRLKRYPLTLEQRFDADVMHLLHFALQNVMHEGTGKKAQQAFRKNTFIAGKTGTSNRQRDSWFAGFDSNKTAVVWLGKDDNSPMPITASTGALPIWANLLKDNTNQSGAPPVPGDVSYLWLDQATGLNTRQKCQNAMYLPVIKGREPNAKVKCTMSGNKFFHWFTKWFQ